MKKTLLLILIVSLCFVFTNCEEKQIEKYQSLIVDSSNDNLSVPSEYSVQGTYFIKKNMPDKSCTFQGKTYVGEYWKSIQNKGNSFVTDCYGNPGSVQFGFKEGTDELVWLALFTKNDFEIIPTLENVADPENTALKIATEIAQEFIDISEYSQEITKYSSTIDGMDVYTVYFKRLVCGYDSSDFIAVTVTSKGTLSSFTIGDINAFKDITLGFEPIEIERSLNKKIENTYIKRNIDAKVTGISNQILIRTANGDICMYSEVSITIKKEGDSTEYSYLITLITEL